MKMSVNIILPAVREHVDKFKDEEHTPMVLKERTIHLSALEKSESIAIIKALQKMPTSSSSLWTTSAAADFPKTKI